MSIRWLTWFAVISAVPLACNIVAPQEKPKPVEKHKRPAAEAKPRTAASAEPIVVPDSDHYGLPFAWEKADSEPLARARNFLAEVLRDNEKYSARGKSFFDPLKKGQQPRATVVTCSDSRLQAAAWDETPENDDFTIRNIGNQVLTALGSVQYGVEHLNTPVLLIIGHTGCGAVKAVISKEHDVPKPIAKELEGMKLPLAAATDSKSKSDTVWAEAVVENVHEQVKQALSKFGSRVVTGKLTVIGGVYDLVGALGKGAGRFSIVDVNGNAEPKRLQAFVAAIQDAKKKPPPSDGEVESPEVSASEQSLQPEAQPLIPDLPQDDLKAAFSDVQGLVANEGAKRMR